ncbi:MAG: hypothetical protein KDE27_26740, partial [Planctomycetes bacterium]|nr:hypothetical protein [Planctomycetota bacterium]
FTATVQALATPAAALALPRTSPFLGAVGAVGWVVGACPLATSGRLLLGAPAAAAVEHGVLAGARQHGRSATELLQANAAPILLVESAGDPDPERDGAARLARLITRKGDTALDLPAAPVVELMRRTGRDDDLLLPFVAAFLQL